MTLIILIVIIIHMIIIISISTNTYRYYYYYYYYYYKYYTTLLLIHIIYTYIYIYIYIAYYLLPIANCLFATEFPIGPLGHPICAQRYASGLRWRCGLRTTSPGCLVQCQSHLRH